MMVASLAFGKTAKDELSGVKQEIKAQNNS